MDKGLIRIIKNKKESFHGTVYKDKVILTNEGLETLNSMGITKTTVEHNGSITEIEIKKENDEIHFNVTRFKKKKLF